MDRSLGELMTTLYEEFLALYGDEDIASVATAIAINDLLAPLPVEKTPEQKQDDQRIAAA